MLKIGFVGAGIVGTALAIRLQGSGYKVSAVASRTLASAEKLAQLVEGCRAYQDKQLVTENADLIFITTPDDVIPRIAAELRWHSGQYVVHCSGADSVDVLEPARKSGSQVGGFHPLQTFANVDRAIANLPGSTFGIEAVEPLLTILTSLAGALGGNWVSLTAKDKAAYHAAAVISSNYLVTLVKMATDLWATFNIPADQATNSLLPLIRGTIKNIEDIGLPRCLTGPIARGDAGTLKKHLSMLDELVPEIAPAYRELGRQTVPIALSKGKINRQQADNMNKILAPVH